MNEWLKQFRQKYPGYDDLDDAALIQKLRAVHQQSYSDMSWDDFGARLVGGGVSPSAPPAQAARGPIPEQAAYSPAVAAERLGGGLGGVLREVVQGITLGGGEELEAALTPQTAEQIREKMRAHAEGGGPVVLPRVLGGVGSAAAAGMTGGAALLPRIGAGLSPGLGATLRALTLGGVGAGTGAVEGALVSDPGERMEGARSGAAWGAGLGLAFPAVAGAASAVRRGGRSISGASIPAEAREGVVDALSTALKPGQKFTDLVAKRGDVLADLNIEGQLAGSAALRDRPSNLGDIYRSLASRDEAVNTALAGRAQRIGGTQPGIGRLEHLQTMAEARSTELNKLYGPIQRIENVADPDIARLVSEIAEDRPSLVAAVRRRTKTPQGVSGNFLVELDKEINSGVNASFRSGAKDSGLEVFRDELQDLMGDRVPGYKEIRPRARQLYGAERAADDAPRWKRAWKVDDIRYKMSRWGPEEIEAFKVGVASDIEGEVVDRISKGSPKSMFKWLNSMKPRIEQVFGADEAADFFGDVARLQRQSETFIEAERGVRGAARPGAERSSLYSQIVTALGYAANRMLGAAFRTGVQSVVRSPAQQRAFSEEVARILYQMPPKDALQLLQKSVPFSDLMRKGLAGKQATTAIMGGQMGGLSNR